MNFSENENIQMCLFTQKNVEVNLTDKRAKSLNLLTNFTFIPIKESVLHKSCNSGM